MAARKQTIIKAVDESCVLPSKKGNGQLNREVWIDAEGNILNYNLAYINPLIFAGDNGRVVGYDNNHGYHHRHYMGETTPVEFTSYEEIEKMFEADWIKFRGKK